MSTYSTYAQIVIAAKKAVPGGRFNKADRAGLIKRAVVMGLRPEAAEAVITEMTRRHRHPATRGIE